MPLVAMILLYYDEDDDELCSITQCEGIAWTFVPASEHITQRGLPSDPTGSLISTLPVHHVIHNIPFLNRLMLV